MIDIDTYTYTHACIHIIHICTHIHKSNLPLQQERTKSRRKYTKMLTVTISKW